MNRIRSRATDPDLDRPPTFKTRWYHAPRKIFSLSFYSQTQNLVPKNLERTSNLERVFYIGCKVATGFGSFDAKLKIRVGVYSKQQRARKNWFFFVIFCELF